jgi:F0F1-type ATP synthase membrane subunit b/b'
LVSEEIMSILGPIVLTAMLATSACTYRDQLEAREEVRHAREDFRRARLEAREELRRARYYVQRDVHQAREDLRRQLRDARRDLHEQLHEAFHH